MKEKEIILNSFSSEDKNNNKKRTTVSFEVPEVQDLNERYASEMPRRRGAAPTRKSRQEEKARTQRTTAPKGMKPTKKKSASSKKKVALILVSVLLILLLIGSCKVIQMVNNPLIGDETDEDIIKAMDAVTDDMVSVLLVGTDGGGTNTDTIMLAVLNNKTKEISLISVPRDTRVPNPYGGSGYAKINSVYNAKGMAGLISQVRDVTGMPINYYAMINFAGFREAIDILGGVEFNVPVRMKYYDPLQNLDIDLYPGLQLLDGDKAEQLVRCRNVYAQADLARTQVQRDFIMATIEQHATAANLLKIGDLYAALEPYVKTSITLGDAIKYGTSVVGAASNMNSYMLPGAAGNYGASGISYFIYDADAAEALAIEIGYEEPKVKRIPSPGKPNSATTDADDVDPDATVDENEDTPSDEDEDTHTDKDNDKDSNKDNDKDKDTSDKDDDKKPSSKPSDKDEEEDKDNTDKDNNKDDGETEPAKPTEPEKPSPSEPEDPADYPDGI